MQDLKGKEFGGTERDGGGDSTRLRRNSRSF